MSLDEYDYVEEEEGSGVETTPATTTKDPIEECLSGYESSWQCSYENRQGNPVCGADGRTYKSRCDLGRCSENTTVECSGECPCSDFKKREMKLVNNIKTFVNEEFGVRYGAIKAVKWGVNTLIDMITNWRDY